MWWSGTLCRWQSSLSSTPAWPLLHSMALKLAAFLSLPWCLPFKLSTLHLPPDAFTEFQSGLFINLPLNMTAALGLILEKSIAHHHFLGLRYGNNNKKNAARHKPQHFVEFSYEIGVWPYDAYCRRADGAISIKMSHFPTYQHKTIVPFSGNHTTSGCFKSQLPYYGRSLHVRVDFMFLLEWHGSRQYGPNTPKGYCSVTAVSTFR